MVSKKEQMAAKMSKRNPLEKRHSIEAVDVLQTPPTQLKPPTELSPKVGDETAPTEPMFFRATKKEKRLIKLYSIEKGVFTQDLLREAAMEYIKKNPID